MDMQIVAVPLFDKDMSVEAYIFRYRKGNDLFSVAQATGIFDGASRSPALEILNQVGLDAFTLGKPIFVPINYIMLLGDLAAQCEQPPDKVVFLFEDAPKPEEPYLSKIVQLRELGYEFAVSNLGEPQKYDAVLKHCKYFFLSQLPERAEHSKQILADLRRLYRNLIVVAAKVDSPDLFEKIVKSGYNMFEAQFFKVPVSEGAREVSPLKSNSIRLINLVQDENFDFGEVSKIVQTDTALTISLLKMVNAPRLGMRNKIRTIQHAVAMLGQKEVRKWVTTAVTQSLGSDKPGEIAKISMIRAKFAENLAPLYEMAHMSQGIFLMGLFSVLDIVLDLPMEEALKMVMVSDVIHNALVDNSGMYAPVLNMVIDYERANWQQVSRHLIVNDMSERDLKEAYLEALTWYSGLISQDEAELLEGSDSEATE